MKAFLAVCALLCLTLASADIYLQTRGSNNRLNEANAERNNGDRLFDSQNNNRGGYNIGEKTSTTATTDTNVDNPENTYDETQTTTAQFYQTVYYEGSIVQFEWTSQHGCGGNEGQDPHLQNCAQVFQYMCDSDNTKVQDMSLQTKMRDGTTTNQVNTDGTDNSRGIHENARYYQECSTRERNKGLFAADQQINTNDARGTRQNPNGDRSGLECPEERDYYPYWRPTPWRDMAYLTDHVEMCPFIQGESQNNNLKYKCYDSTNNPPSATILSKVTKDSCSDAGGTWTQHKWNLPAPECKQVAWGRSNHLGNGNRELQMLNYNWTVPKVDDLVASGASTYGAGLYVKCAVRTRYNISTDDYDPWNTTASSNGNNSPVKNNPTVDVGADLQGLKLAMNTNQFGRTFQDRTHTFFIRKRPNTITADTRIINMAVRGKRGNIVQTYPAHEYDFQPNRLHALAATDLIHLQWTGSNTHNNNPDSDNAGDGQGGDAGEGTDGTDRHNFVQISNMDTNMPLPLDKYQSNSFFTNLNCFKLDGSPIGITAAGQINKDCALWLATSGYYRQTGAVQGFAGNNDVLSVTLDNAPPSLVGGVLLKSNTPGSYNFISTRNNNFSNRSQKATIVINPVIVTNP